MSLQPGVGYSFAASSHGTTLDINPVWSNLTSTQPQITPDGGGEIFIEDGETTGTVNVMVAKMRVLIQDRWEGTGYDLTTAEYAINGIYAYPTGSKVAGTDATSIFCDDGSKFALANAANGGKDGWLLCLIRQPMNKSGQLIGPQLVIMSGDSDAYEKTTPWGEADTTDSIRLYGGLGATAVEIDGSPSGYLVSGFAPSPVQYNYNCQRVNVASVTWNATTNAWDVTQLLSGTITLPNIIQYYGIQLVVAGGTSPFITWPQYETECDAWNGAWTGYSKPSMQTSVILPVGMPG